jgi:hypothetical protein
LGTGRVRLPHRSISERNLTRARHYHFGQWPQAEAGMARKR